MVNARSGTVNEIVTEAGPVANAEVPPAGTRFEPPPPAAGPNGPIRVAWHAPPPPPPNQPAPPPPPPKSPAPVRLSPPAPPAPGVPAVPASTGLMAHVAPPAPPALAVPPPPPVAPCGCCPPGWPTSPASPPGAVLGWSGWPPAEPPPPPATSSRGSVAGTPVSTQPALAELHVRTSLDPPPAPPARSGPTPLRPAAPPPVATFTYSVAPGVTDREPVTVAPRPPAAPAGAWAPAAPVATTSISVTPAGTVNGWSPPAVKVRTTVAAWPVVRRPARPPWPPSRPGAGRGSCHGT